MGGFLVIDREQALGDTKGSILANGLQRTHRA